QLLDHGALGGGRFDQLDRRVATAGEAQAGHVVENDDVVAGGGGGGVLPADAVEGIEHGEERLGLERVPAGDDEDVDEGGHPPQLLCCCSVTRWLPICGPPTQPHSCGSHSRSSPRNHRPRTVNTPRLSPWVTWMLPSSSTS